MMVATSESADAALHLVELPSVSLRARELRVKVRAIGVNPVDWKMRSGGPMRVAHRLIGPRGPLVVGVDFAGEVVESKGDLAVGTRVVGGTDFSRGQRGSYADEVVVRDDQCAVLPESVAFESAACLPVPGSTALEAFRVGRVAGGSNVLVLGASGGVGVVTVQLAKARGMNVTGVCSARNVALIERLGAKAVDYGAGDPFEATRGLFDLIVHAVGTETYSLEKCRAVLAPRGVVALVVVKPHDYLSLLSSRVSAVLGRPNRKSLEPLVQALARGDLEPIVEARLPLAEAERAHQISRSGKVVGKLLLIP